MWFWNHFWWSLNLLISLRHEYNLFWVHHCGLLISQLNIDVKCWGENRSSQGIQCMLPLKRLCRNLCLQAQVPSQNTVCICSWFRICLAVSQLCIDLSPKYDRDSCSLRFSTRIWNYSPLPRQLMFFSFQICLGSTDSHTLVYFFSVSCFMVFVLSGRATVMNSTLLLFIKKQISLVCVPRVFEFIDMILFQ